MKVQCQQIFWFLYLNYFLISERSQDDLKGFSSFRTLLNLFFFFLAMLFNEEFLSVLQIQADFRIETLHHSDKENQRELEISCPRFSESFLERTLKTFVYSRIVKIPGYLWIVDQKSS